MEMVEICWVNQDYGPRISYNSAGKTKLLKEGGQIFKNSSGSGKLEKYEDWRLSPEERADDLLSKMNTEQKIGMMIGSLAFSVPSDERFTLHGRQQTYHGKLFSESGLPASAISDQMHDVIVKEKIRFLYIGGINSTGDVVTWNNNIQALAENMPLGIPVSLSTDPRHGVFSKMRNDYLPGEEISLWPEGIGLAATYDPELARECGEIQSEELRAMGITHLMGPQIDLASEPRWCRLGDTFGENTSLVTDLARAYIDGCQTTKYISDGWGKESVVCMVKHWPGGGCGEGGRDAHYNFGKYGVYPGNNFTEHQKPFEEGAFALDGPTKKAAGILSYYVIPLGQDVKNGENVGSGFSEYLINDLLRRKNDYDGVVCSDWEIVTDQGETVYEFAGKCWGGWKTCQRESECGKL